MHEWYGVRVGGFKVKTFLAKEREHLGVKNRVTLIEHNHFPKKEKKYVKSINNKTSYEFRQLQQNERLRMRLVYFEK